jgi:SpoVK/Ycf46/Vps4 family AAA+-type ATPase
LQLKQTQKDMLLALVHQHESHDNSTDTIEDIIEGNGRSLVILLHGPPGVGKTLMAETVAKATGKPLIIVSVAEIGIKADQAESKLERLFAYAARWEAILPVDEADVFLEARSSEAGTERNALVSVLLLVLEY